MKSVEIENVGPPLARGPVLTGFHDKGSRGGLYGLSK
jgi:hypothetical protein